MDQPFRWTIRLACAALAVLTASAALGQTPPPNARIELVLEQAAAAPGETVWIGVRQTIREGWHTYWRNPGDAGQPTEVRWRTPKNLEVGELLWPAPERISEGPVTVYGYHGAPVFLAPVRIAPDAPEGIAEIVAEARWLVCDDVCIPEEGAARARLEIRADGGALDPARAALFEAAGAALPAEAPWSATYAVDGGRVSLAVRDAALGAAMASGRIEAVDFFPIAENALENGGALGVAYGPDGVRLDFASSFALKDIATLAGVLTFEERLPGGLARRAFSVTAQPGPIPEGVAAQAFGAAAGSETRANGLTWGAALAMAVLGGLILNLMPCVFPVLFVKAVAFSARAHAPGELRAHGLLCTVGVLTTFLALAGGLIALKAGGAALGWGYQLQTPSVVAALAYVMFLVGLSLSGVFELGARLMGLGQGLAGREGAGGAFFTGVLAVVVAAPCTAPFMAAALGFAFTQPAAIALSVFAALGLGLAAPYLLLSFTPALSAVLPKPGPWMDRLKQAMAFPMYGAAVWLLWVLSRQAGPDAAALVLAGMVLLAFAAWALSASRGAGAAWRSAGLATSFAAAAGALVFAMPALQPAAAVAVSAAPSPLNARPFSEAEVEALRREGAPVFIDFTAAWCITCQSNKLTALHRPAVVEAFKARGVVFMTADWTNQDPEITRALERFGRNGVPLYVYYPANAGEAVILPQILTERTVLRALAEGEASAGAADATSAG